MICHLEEVLDSGDGLQVGHTWALEEGDYPDAGRIHILAEQIGRMGPVSPSIQPPTKEEEIRNLKERARVLEEQLEAIEKRIKDLDKEGA